MDGINTNIINQSAQALVKNNADAAYKAAQTPKNMDEIDHAAQEMEAVFLSQMLTHMFEGIETDDTFGGGQAEDIYKSMLTQEYGKLMAQSGGIGLADSLKAEMIKMQEGLMQ